MASSDLAPKSNTLPLVSPAKLAASSTECPLPSVPFSSQEEQGGSALHVMGKQLLREVGHDLEASDSDGFDELCLSASTFKWRYTMSYWTAVMFLQGSFLFMFSAGIGVFKQQLHWSQNGHTMIQKWSNFAGAFCFTAGVYFNYLQLINIHTEGESAKPKAFLRGDWKAIREHVHLASRIGTIVYLVGAVFFHIGVIASVGGEFSAKFSGTIKHVLCDIPNLLGSTCFLIGGMCEIVHNGVFEKNGPGMCKAVWWASVMNTLGGLNFVLATAPAIIAPHWDGEWWVDLNYCFGSALFVVSSILMLVMWRANEFGLLLLRQLNFSQCSPRHGDAIGHLRRSATSSNEKKDKRMFSMRGTCFIVVYCWYSVMTIVALLCYRLWFMHAIKPHTYRHYGNVFGQIQNVFFVQVVLMIHSVVTHVPKFQPFRTIIIGTRVSLVLGAIAQTFRVLDFCLIAYDDADKAAQSGLTSYGIF